MIGDKKVWERWETEYLKSEPPDYWRNLKLVEALYEQARVLGVFPLADPLEGLEVKVRMAKVLNVSTASGKNRAGS